MKTCDICGDNFTPEKHKHSEKRCSKKCWNKARALTAQKGYWANPEEKRAVAKVREAEKRKNDPDYKLKQKDSYLQLYYGIGIAEYAWMNYLQDGKCYMCEKVCASGKALAVDHDHKTGKVRKLLCASCNNGLGRFGDNAELMRRGADYLDKEMSM